MPLVTFKDVLTAIKHQLESDPALTAFFKDRFSKTHTVDIAYKHRKNIQLSELPIILITRSSVEKQQDLTALHTVNFYAGFHQKDRKAGVIDAVVLEDLLDAAVLADTTFSGLADSSRVLSSANDEGVYQPVYFCVTTVEVKFTRRWIDDSDLPDFLKG
ncbi:MAG: hypothetical protein GY874_14330 [Desulfobacteraceae bacterium]|nr:hypothetical protein [Desulfobacteraceae bacterium]